MPRVKGAFLVIDGYDRAKEPRRIEVRNPYTIDEMAEWCGSHSHILAKANDGRAVNVKINGAVRRWKRDRNRIAVSVKYGMYECCTFDASDIHRILIPVE